MDLSDTALITNRSLNSSLYLFFGGLLGSIFGLMGVFATVMSLTESVINPIKASLLKRRSLQRIIGSRITMLDKITKKSKMRVKIAPSGSSTIYIE